MSDPQLAKQLTLKLFSVSLHFLSPFLAIPLCIFNLLVCFLPIITSCTLLTWWSLSPLSCIICFLLELSSVWMKKDPGRSLTKIRERWELTTVDFFLPHARPFLKFFFCTPWFEKASVSLSTSWFLWVLEVVPSFKHPSCLKSYRHLKRSPVNLALRHPSFFFASTYYCTVKWIRFPFSRGGNLCWRNYCTLSVANSYCWREVEKRIVVKSCDCTLFAEQCWQKWTQVDLLEDKTQRHLPEREEMFVLYLTI